MGMGPAYGPIHTGEDLPFVGCVNAHACFPRAHGGVRIVQVRAAGGQWQRRECNRNAGVQEVGEWETCTWEEVGSIISAGRHED